MGRAADAGGSDGQPSHERSAYGGGSRATHDRVETDEAKGGPHCVTAQKRLERALHDASEHSDLEPAKDEQVDEAGGDQRLLELRGDSVADAKHHAEEKGGVRGGQRSVQGCRVALAQPGG